MANLTLLNTPEDISQRLLIALLSNVGLTTKMSTYYPNTGIYVITTDETTSRTVNQTTADDLSKIVSNAIQQVASASESTNFLILTQETIYTLPTTPTLYDIGFNYLFQAPTDEQGGDLIYFQGHATPSVYARRR